MLGRWSGLYAPQSDTRSTKVRGIASGPVPTGTRSRLGLGMCMRHSRSYVMGFSPVCNSSSGGSSNNSERMSVQHMHEQAEGPGQAPVQGKCLREVNKLQGFYNGRVWSMHEGLTCQQLPCDDAKCIRVCCLAPPNVHDLRGPEARRASYLQ